MKVAGKDMLSPLNTVKNLIAFARKRGGKSMADKLAAEILDAYNEQGGAFKRITHRLGHQIGLDVHEPGDVSAAHDAPVQAGMVFSIEPGIYLPGEFGVRIEDLVLVTEDGCEVLNSYPRELVSIG